MLQCSRKDQIKNADQRKANPADGESKDDPFCLLAFSGRGHTPVAIDLRAHTIEDEKAENEIEPGVLAGGAVGEYVKIDQKEDGTQSHPARPARHKAATGKEENEQEDTGCAENI